MALSTGQLGIVALFLLPITVLSFTFYVSGICLNLKQLNNQLSGKDLFVRLTMHAFQRSAVNLRIY